MKLSGRVEEASTKRQLGPCEISVSHSVVGEGNDTPLQYCCLENPMDGGTWWAGVHGVAKLDTTEQFHFHFSLSCIGEGNGSPLQCSCLENPRDGVAWRAAVHGVAQSQTRLKRLSSSSSTQWCPTLCDPMDYSPQGSSVHGILQERILGGLPFPSPGELSDSGIKPRPPALQVDSLLSELPGKPWNNIIYICLWFLTQNP